MPSEYLAEVIIHRGFKLILKKSRIHFLLCIFAERFSVQLPITIVTHFYQPVAHASVLGGAVVVS